MFSTSAPPTIKHLSSLSPVQDTFPLWLWINQTLADGCCLPVDESSSTLAVGLREESQSWGIPGLVRWRVFGIMRLLTHSWGSRSRLSCARSFGWPQYLSIPSITRHPSIQTPWSIHQAIPLIQEMGTGLNWSNPRWWLLFTRVDESSSTLVVRIREGSLLWGIPGLVRWRVLDIRIILTLSWGSRSGLLCVRSFGRSLNIH